MAVVSLTLPSEALGGSKLTYVYLPPGYAESEERYPVLYLLRGHEREWINPAEDASRGGRTAASIADELIGEGRVPPVIMVMPGLASDDNRIAGLGVNLLAPELAAGAPGVGPGRFEDYLVGELIPAVDREFRTRADRRYRAVDGFSLGGFSALSLALRRPELFASVGAFDGTFLYERATRPDGSRDPLADHAVFAPALGSPLDMNRFQLVNPADLIASLPAERLRSLRFHLHSGPAGAEPDVNFFRTEAVVSALGRRGISNSFDPFALEGAGHNWHWADEHLKLALVKHAEMWQQK